MIECADVLPDGSEIETDLLACFANRCRQQRIIGRILVPARKRHVARPRIAGFFGAANEQQFGCKRIIARVFTQDDGNRRLTCADPHRRLLRCVNRHTSFDVG